ncbi:hypothetical protein DFH08DRAFT_1087523 [Mycena albidolilacea]|uniref:Uncharacterized protein n=1 Tax=Mycena albidolilacea TaxID=1033008 RepID=A0AAD6Z9U4_9AGAR|nr:hypothetical protein DFH08DRAFT_1087523 [Mycena albidolilacea]
MSYDPNYDNFNVYGLQRELGWPTQQQPAVSQQPQFLPNYHVPPAPNPALHVAYPMQSQGPVHTLHVPAPKSTRKQPANAAKEPSEPKYSPRNLLDIVQTAIEVGLFTAKHGEKGKKLIEFGTAVRKLGIAGSDATLKSRLLEVMNFHEDPATAPAPIVKAIEGSHYEITLGAPLDLLAAQQRQYVDKTDAEKEKMLKKATEDKKGGEAIRNASLHRSRRTAAQHMAEEESDDDDDAVVVLEAPSAPPVTPPIPLMPVAPVRSLTPFDHHSWSPPPPVDLLHCAARLPLVVPSGVDKWESDDDSDIEIISHTLPSGEASINGVIVKAEPLPASIPAPATATKLAAVMRFKTENPLASIPRGSRKASTSKRIKGDDSDTENSPPTVRKTKRKLVLEPESQEPGEYPTRLNALLILAIFVYVFLLSW